MIIKSISELNNIGLQKEAKDTIMWFFSNCIRHSLLRSINVMNEKLSYLECILADNGIELGYINYTLFPATVQTEACVALLNVGFPLKLTESQQSRMLYEICKYLKIFNVPIVYLGKTDTDMDMIAKTGLVDAIISITELEEN